MSNKKENASLGGKTRAKNLTTEKKKEIATKAAEARWSKTLPEVAYGSASRPLKLGGAEIPCYVLDNDLRVLTQKGILDALEMARGGRDGDRLESFVSTKSISPHVSEGLSNATIEPIRFKVPGKGGLVAYGYEATILADICEAMLAARRAGALLKHQLPIADRCEILMSAFAKVGIIALVDEATGFQYARARNALEEILHKYISAELLPWTKLFGDDYYSEMFRLRGWDRNPLDSKKPGIVGHDTVDVVYARLAPGVLEELKRLTPRNEKNGKLTHKLHQRLTEEVGHPALRKHLERVVTLMEASRTWDEFKVLLDRRWPRLNTQILLALPPTSEENPAGQVFPSSEQPPS